MRFIYLFIILFYFFQYVNSAYCIDAPEIVKKVKKKYESIKSFSAEFTQSFQWKLAGETQQRHGEIVLKGFDKFRIETEGQLIVSDGNTIWTYSNDNNQVIIDKMSNSDEVLLPRQIFLKFSQNYSPSLLREEKYADIDCYVIRLIAKNEDVFIKEMEIWVQKNSWITTKINHIDINDNITTYTLSNIETNEKIDDKKFIYQIPENVEVIDMR